VLFAVGRHRTLHRCGDTRTVQQQSAATAATAADTSDPHWPADLRQRSPATFLPLDGKEKVHSLIRGATARRRRVRPYWINAALRRGANPSGMGVRYSSWHQNHLTSWTTSQYPSLTILSTAVGCPWWGLASVGTQKYEERAQCQIGENLATG
jgi:hypothetical protein